MAATKAEIEGLVMGLALALFFGYNGWLLFLRARIAKWMAGGQRPRHHGDFFGAGKARAPRGGDRGRAAPWGATGFTREGVIGRAIFTEAVAKDPKEAILAVQQARNAMTASTYLATISSVLATAGITILLDPTRTQQMHDLAMRDPILRRYPGDLLVGPEVVLMTSLGTLYMSFLCFAQSVRLYVHWGFYVRCISSDLNQGALTMEDAKVAAVRAGVAFTMGMRLFVLFIVLILWTGGVTWMLVGSIVVTCFLAYFDHFDSLLPADRHVEDARDEALEEISLLEAGFRPATGSVSAGRRSGGGGGGAVQITAISGGGAAPQPAPSPARGPPAPAGAVGEGAERGGGGGAGRQEEGDDCFGDFEAVRVAQPVAL
ncbi:MAG: hypothetical protein J3K34DRAFT_522957 [Monoraphidium minutum]|nr:MAG: hypothetical protein J3K34DRAFT_522957 [Monoraphidium minutum]